MTTNTLSVIRYTAGRSGYGLQETDAVGTLAALYDEDGEQLSRVPNCEWELVREVGAYAEGDSDAFWALVEQAQGEPSEGWTETGIPGVSVQLKTRIESGSTVYPARVSISGHGDGWEATGAQIDATHRDLREGLAALGYRLTSTASLDTWEAGEGDDEQVCFLAEQDTETVGPLLATYYVTVREAGSDRRTYPAHGLHAAVRDANELAKGIPRQGGSVVVSLEDPREPGPDAIPLVVVRR